jgi:hypothetical protein
MYTLGTIREFETENFRVIVDAVEETDLDLSWDEDGQTSRGLENGSLIAFCARARVLWKETGEELGTDYLGGCIYKSLDDFQDHRECAKQTRAILAKEGKFSVYVGTYKDGVLRKGDKLNRKPINDRATAEAWGKSWSARRNNAPFHILENAGCGSYFADMVSECIRSARQNVSKLQSIKLREVK